MVGGIYTEERCPLPDCGKRMTDNGKDAVCCPAHPKIKAEKLFVKFGRDIKKRFTKYEEAFQFLHGLRFEKWQGKFDKREYVPGQLLSFSTMADKYIEVKRLRHDAEMTAKKTYYAVRNELGLAKAYFGDRNIKDISLIDLEQLFLSLSRLSSKSVYNLRTNLLAFWRWLVKAREIGVEEVPEFPEWEYELGWRKTISKNSQEEILEEVKRLSKKSPRIYLAIRWLTIYVSIRPSELRTILDRDVHLDEGLVVMPHHKNARKKKEPKIVPLLPEDIKILKSLPRSFDGGLPLFRHDRAYNRVQANTPFGEKILYKYWKKACDNLEIEGVDLYGGTRHSTMGFYRQHMSTEDVMRLSDHTTSKAGLRYLKVQKQEMLEGYALASRTTKPDHAARSGPRPDHRRSRATHLKSLNS